jgi:excinuclease ABC subunit A
MNKIKLKGITHHNLKNIDIEFYASGINILTGSSGSGKSSLLFDVLYNSILHKRPVNCDFIELYAIFEQVIAVNQDTPSVSGLSSPVTFCGIFDYIRDEFAKEAKKMDSQIGKSYFSPNSPGGRCETCKGQGFLKTSLDFLPDNYSVCPDCNGRRFTREAQDFKLYEKSIADVLEMSVNEALVFFTNFPNIEHALYSLSETNLGYLKLGQSLNSLSGGELQRLKLAKEIIKPSQAKSLILLDEPTTGLHFEDVKHLLLLLDKMVKDGHTIIMTEHNPVVILNADYVIDMGPGGGDKGGKIMAHGTPFEIMEVKESLTGNYLKERYVKPN